jgi:methyltransferase (TIGR00027 family)
MAADLIADVADTAFWVAYYRAEETRRKDAIFRDPLAARLAGERGRKIAEGMKLSQYTRWSVVMRTRVIDEYIAERIADGIDTVVNLGAGLDTRPYRLNLPAAVRWVEVDHPKIIEFKERQLIDETSHCKLERIGLDLAQREARVRLFADLAAKSQSILVLTEGVIPYLTVEETASLADDLREQPHFKYWLVEYYATEVMRYLKKARGLGTQMKNAPFQFFPDDWFAFFAAHGWKVGEMRYLAEMSEKLNRPVPMPWWGKLLQGFLPAKRRAASKKYMGYALLER